MRIHTNTTSLYVRIARIALAEKGFDFSGTQIVNPWADDPDLLRLNPAARVPALELEDGLPLTESLLILLWLERKVSEPSLPAGPVDRIVSLAGRAMGIIDAMAIVTATMQGPELWRDPRRPPPPAVDLNGFRTLESDPSACAGGTTDVAVITTVTAVDYSSLRFKDAPWVEPIPRLDALRDEVAERPSYAKTLPNI
jgi:glutathione S-transferase